MGNARKKTTTEASMTKGGVITRLAKSGRFVSVETKNGVSKPSAKTKTVTEEISIRRASALKRLKDR